VLRRKEEMTKEIRERMRGGTGEMEILHIFKQQELKGKIRLLAHLCLKQNCSVGYHTHEHEEEIFYILKGRGIVQDNDKEYEVGPGDAILTGDGAGHAIRNEQSEPLELMAIILLYV
jgi:mannose-6-phosphate isomerase-like protein (cupin superfamily)